MTSKEIMKKIRDDVRRNQYRTITSEVLMHLLEMFAEEIITNQSEGGTPSSDEGDGNNTGGENTGDNTGDEGDGEEPMYSASPYFVNLTSLDDSSISVEWAGDVENYKVAVSNGTEETVNGTTYTVGNLDANTEYEITVSAVEE